MKTLAALALVVLAAAPAAAQARRVRHHADKAHHAGKTYDAGHCRVTVPADWRSRRGGGMASPGRETFNVVVTRTRKAPDMKKLARVLRGRVISSAKGRQLMLVSGVGPDDARQYWAATDGAPSCRATVTFSDRADEARARRIAESVSPRR